ncbi:hypothetical protein H6775_02010 [Candidatus Nomurabacteria bacterium]|nr:hypothetical protein [Candidatus Nomurabacteria bacterium]
MAKLSFLPKQIVKKLLATIPERSRDVLTRRYGLGTGTKQQTLESIGQIYGITRERVRQIEEYSIANIRKSEEFEKAEPFFNELKDLIRSLGGVIGESDFLGEVSTSKSTQNQIHFLLVLGNSFKQKKENNEFVCRWCVDEELANQIEGSIKKLYSDLDDEDIIPESKMLKDFLDHLKDVSEEYKDEEILKRWLGMSKTVNSNPLGEWGKANSPNINVKGMRDYAYLVIRQHGSPIHFREVAEKITKIFNKKAHVATCHNELIKDSRFVLVGRGLYALSEWGYISGVVRDVIKKLIDKYGPLTKDEIVDKVLKERYVKDNTIMVNLQNPQYFKRDTKGRYHNA